MATAANLSSPALTSHHHQNFLITHQPPTAAALCKTSFKPLKCHLKPLSSAFSRKPSSPHRGQEGAGIVSVESKVLHSITGVGLVSEVFTPSKLDQLPGSAAIGHVRLLRRLYKASDSVIVFSDVHTRLIGHKFGSVGVTHNGNLVNYKTLRSELEEHGGIFNKSSDTEVVLPLIAVSKARPFFEDNRGLLEVEGCVFNGVLY
ncbi:hypothetical protein MLD38_026755 [Melastoma candidum]|uniref:Uncharacterized protein n=1 Tax=Melastoma candidum TaxID=119954 RepID=A0ACB9P028_9MYRT|nr:hypothetical protein MLD38_026755 [Melastoma candidum]